MSISTRQGFYYTFCVYTCAFAMSISVLMYVEHCSALGTWVFSVLGALVAIPVGIRRKSLAPLVFFGTTGTMLDIIMGISACEREHAERQMKLLEAQNSAAAAASLVESDTEVLK